MLFLEQGSWISEYVSWSNSQIEHRDPPCVFIMRFPETEMISWENVNADISWWIFIIYDCTFVFIVRLQVSLSENICIDI